MLARLGTLAFALALLLTTPLAAADHTGDVRLDPARELGLFPTHEAVEDLVRKAAARPWATLHELGATGEGRPILALEITDPESAVPREERIVTLLLTQQHGNEPAGTGAAAVLLQRFLDQGIDRALFSDQVLILLPMANPDGAEAATRGNADGVDVNRDHVGLETREARAIHEAIHRFGVDFALDHHEYGGTGVGNPVPLRVYDYDLTTMVPNHGNVPAPIREASESFMYDVLWPAAEARGFSANEYGEQTLAGVPVRQVAGGPDPGILRNSVGLNEVVGLLIESRVDGHPNPFHDANRRIEIHLLVMETALAHAHAAREALLEARRAAAALPAPTEYAEGERRGPLPQAFLVPDAASAVLDLHRLAHHAHDAERLVPTTERPGLVGALFHEKSSRAVLVGTPAALPDALLELLGATERATPAAGLPALLAALGVLALARPRR